MEISFENTKIAFASKSDKELKKAQFLFKAMHQAWLVRMGTRLTPWLLKWGVPIDKIIKHTIFTQFVGGENLDDTKSVVEKLESYQVKVILDYGVEGKEGEASFETSKNEFIKVIEYAGLQPNIPFISIKITGFARFSLLQKIDASIDSSIALNGVINEQILTAGEIIEWNDIKGRLLEICEKARECNIGVLIDAEESWIQNPVDALCMEMMEIFNQDKAIIYNTIQLYRHDRLQFLKSSLEISLQKNFVLGAKLVRGAYMEKERKRAKALNYTSPIQVDKIKTDSDYNEAIDFCVKNLDKMYTIVASHNEASNLYTTTLLNKTASSELNPRIHFSQLYGMSDNITFNLAQAGYSVSKYLPFGPLRDVIPYLMRRAQENSSVSGQTGRELSLIQKELERRKLEG